MYKKLSIDLMADRVLRRVPELSRSFVVSEISTNGQYSLREIDVFLWVQYFDSIVIDEEGIGL